MSAIEGSLSKIVQFLSGPPDQEDATADSEDGAEESSEEEETTRPHSAPTTTRGQHTRHVPQETGLNTSEERIARSIVQQLQGTTSMQHIVQHYDSASRKHSKQPGPRQPYSPLLQQAYELDAPEVDDENVLYFPKMWPQLANVSTEERRTLLKTIKDATTITHPKHKDKLYQVEHLLLVLRFVLKEQPEAACKAIADRLLFLNQAVGKNLDKAVSFYDTVTKATRRPNEYSEADIISNLPRHLTGKQHNLLSQKFKKSEDRHQGDQSHKDPSTGGAAGQGSRQDGRHFPGGGKKKG